MLQNGDYLTNLSGSGRGCSSLNTYFNLLGCFSRFNFLGLHLLLRVFSSYCRAADCRSYLFCYPNSYCQNRSKLRNFSLDLWCQSSIDIFLQPALFRMCYLLIDDDCKRRGFWGLIRFGNGKRKKYSGYSYISWLWLLKSKAFRSALGFGDWSLLFNPWQRSIGKRFFFILAILATYLLAFFGLVAMWKIHCPYLFGWLPTRFKWHTLSLPDFPFDTSKMTFSISTTGM